MPDEYFLDKASDSESRGVAKMIDKIYIKRYLKGILACILLLIISAIPLAFTLMDTQIPSINTVTSKTIYIAQYNDYEGSFTFGTTIFSRYTTNSITTNTGEKYAVVTNKTSFIKPQIPNIGEICKGIKTDQPIQIYLFQGTYIVMMKSGDKTIISLNDSQEALQTTQQLSIVIGITLPAAILILFGYAFISRAVNNSKKK